MTADKFTATWLSHTSISDFLKCPRSYFLKNVYKDKKNGHKIQIVTPALSLGSIIHEVLESLSNLPTDDRFRESLVIKLDQVWPKISGKKGGFNSLDEEHRYKERGKAMMRRVMDHPGPLTSLAVKIKESLPYFWLSEQENLILCGKVDWLEYLKDIDGVHIIDFKTSTKEEVSDSLQLSIYHLLVVRCQHRLVKRASYWYLDFSDTLNEKKLPDIAESERQVLEIGRKIKLARSLDRLECPQGREGCQYCRPMDAILRGEGELVATSDRRDSYILSANTFVQENIEESIIL